MHRLQRAVLLFALFVCVMQSVRAQETRASISGRILDRSGAVIPGVTVSAANIATGVMISTIANETGNYRIDYLIPGRYELAASQPGFKITKRTVDLRTGDHLQIDFTLEVGELAEEVTVIAETPLLQTANADLSQIVDKARIETLPLAQGNPTHLLVMAPGAAAPASTSYFKFDEPAWSEASSTPFHGTRGGSTGFTLNGVNNSLSYSGGSTSVNLQPPTEAIEEIKISHAYDASQGHHSGTTVDITLKSGTNDFQGSVYGFFRDSDLNAGAFFDNRAGVRKPASTYRRIGAGIFGPIVKNRTFFAFSYEDTFQRTTELYGSRTVPTPEMLRGDFSKLLALGPQYQIYDPYTTRPTGDGLFRRDPFPNNIIPANRIHPIAKKLMEFWPAPNLTGGPDGTQNFQPSTPSPTEWWQSVARVDHTFSPKHRIFAHFANIDEEGQWRDYYGNLATGFWENIKRRNFGIDDVYAINPNWLLNFRYGFTRASDPRLHKSHKRSPGGFFDITTLGLSPALVSQLDLDQSSLPHIFIQGFSGIHDETRNFYDASNSHSAEALTDINHGNHNFKLGFEFRGTTLNRMDNTFVMPRYHFGCDFTNGPLNTSPCAQGQAFAAFLLGQPSGGLIRRAANFAAYNSYYSWFVQDNWRATSRLTVNYGLRWEYYGPITERFNRSVRGFDFGASSPIEAAARAAYARNPIPEIPADQFRVQGGYTFAGVGGQPRKLYDTPANLFAPRIGFAYRFGDHSVMRGGYGLFHIPIGISGETTFQPQLAGFSRTTELIPTLDNGVTFIADIFNPFPGGILAPLGAAGGLATDMGLDVAFFNTDDLKVPYNQRWSLSFQHMLPNQTVLEVGYVGTRGTGLIVRRNLNFLPQQYLSTKPFRDQATIDFLSRAIPNPFAGLLPGTGLNANVISRDQLLRPFPHFRSVFLNQTNQGYTWYHGLEMRIEKRLSKGHSYVVSYNWSKAMEATNYLNEGDIAPYETIASFDRTHAFKFTGIWELPFGRGKRFGSGVSSGLSRVISGWQVTILWHVQSGFPLTFGDVFVEDNFNVKNLSLPKNQRTVDRWFNTGAGFVRDPRSQPAFHLRTFPMRFSSLRTDAVNFWDISVIKNTYITEKTSIQFQAQFLNAFNHPSFAGVVTNPASGSFGRVTDEMTWPRRIMFGMKFVF